MGCRSVLCVSWRILVFITDAGVWGLSKQKGSRDADIFTTRQECPKALQQNSTCGPIQLLDLCFVSIDEELVQVVLGRGLVIVPPAHTEHLYIGWHQDLSMEEHLCVGWLQDLCKTRKEN